MSANVDISIIETHGLSKVYKGVQALQSLNLKVPKNSIYGMLATSTCSFTSPSP